jgi:hypothetical protein
LSLNNFIVGTKKERIITLIYRDRWREGGRERENKITVLVNISILNGVAQGMYYSFFVVAKNFCSGHHYKV